MSKVSETEILTRKVAKYQGWLRDLNFLTEEAGLLAEAMEEGEVMKGAAQQLRRTAAQLGDQRKPIEGLIKRTEKELGK